jgi:Uma2 family endonuclease
VRWETYVALADDRQGSVPRMTYSQGRLELMSPKKEHEKVKSLLGRMIHCYCDWQQIEIESVASTTFRRQDLGRGFEADESYYIAHAETVRSKEELDLAVDPPPDLVIEIEITASAIAKMELFAAMGVPEVWRHDGQSLRLFRLAESDYQSIFASVALPGFPVAVAERLLNQRLAQGETSLIRQFRSTLG